MTRSVLSFALLFGCSMVDERTHEFVLLEAKATSVCEIMAHPQMYLGRRVLAHGVYFQSPHQRYLIEKSCPQSEISVSESSTLHNSRMAMRILKQAEAENRTVNIPVIYSGIFRSDVVIAGCADPRCYNYSLQDAQLLAATRR
jgi:hypothetical protein